MSSVEDKFRIKPHWLQDGDAVCGQGIVKNVDVRRFTTRVTFEESDEFAQYTRTYSNLFYITIWEDDK